jgi:hypothetical protein
MELHGRLGYRGGLGAGRRRRKYSRCCDRNVQPHMYAHMRTVTIAPAAPSCPPSSEKTRLPGNMSRWQSDGLSTQDPGFEPDLVHGAQYAPSSCRLRFARKLNVCEDSFCTPDGWRPSRLRAYAWPELAVLRRSRTVILNRLIEMIIQLGFRK